MADFLNGLYFSEILADNAGDTAVDIDGDGNINKSDEFIEIGNVSGGTLSLDGIEIWSATNGQLYSFGASDTIGDGEAATVVGNYDGTPPPGHYSAGISEGNNFIPDGEGSNFDTLFIVDTNTGEYIAFSYGEPPQPYKLPPGFPGTTQVGSGEEFNSGAPNGTSFSRDANGDWQETGPTPGTPSVACFLEGTRILTPRGEIAVEHLRAGDLVTTRDNGTCRIEGIGTRHVPPCDLLRSPRLRPVQVARVPGSGASGICLSQSHCVLASSPVAELLFGHSEVLVRSSMLLQAGLARSFIPRHGARYFHIALETHEIVLSDGMWTETFLHTGALFDPVRDASHWTLRDGTLRLHDSAARRILKRHEAEVLLRMDAQMRNTAPKLTDYATYPARMQNFA